MPRLGFAWSATPRFVLRGGYGLQNYMEGTGANLRMTTNLPFQSTYLASGAQATSINLGNFFLVQNGFSNPASGAAASGAVFNVWNKHIKPAFIGMYSLTVEYEVNNTASASPTPDSPSTSIQEPTTPALTGTRSAPINTSSQTYGASVLKDFSIWHEQKINFRADADNLFNSAYLGNPVGNIASSSFGDIQGQATPIRSGPRQLQLSLKYSF